MSLPRTDGPPQGRPSPAAQARLADSVRRELGDLEVRIEEARLRAEVFRVTGRPEEAAKTLAEQQVLLTSFATRLQAAISSSVVERDAEDVVAAALAERVVESPTTEIDHPRRRPVLSGVASALAVVAALAITLLPGRGPAAIDAIGAADVADEPPTAPAEEPSAGRGAVAPPASDDGTPEAGIAPSAGVAANSDETGGRADVDGDGVADTNPDPRAPEPGLTALVEDLLNAVNGTIATPPESFGEPSLPVPDLPPPSTDTEAGTEVEPSESEVDPTESETEPTGTETEAADTDGGDAESDPAWWDGTP